MLARSAGQFEDNQKRFDAKTIFCRYRGFPIWARTASRAYQPDWAGHDCRWNLWTRASKKSGACQGSCDGRFVGEFGVIIPMAERKLFVARLAAGRKSPDTQTRQIHSQPNVAARPPPFLAAAQNFPMVKGVRLSRNGKPMPDLRPAENQRPTRNDFSAASAHSQPLPFSIQNTQRNHGYAKKLNHLDGIFAGKKSPLSPKERTDSNANSHVNIT